MWPIFRRGEGLSCSKPALGINVYYRNFSGVPVVIEEDRLEVKMGTRPLFLGPGEEEWPRHDVILAGGTSLAVSKSGSPIAETYPRLHGYGVPPYFNLELTVTFRSLISGKRYRYTGKITMFADCRLPDQKLHTLGPEAITEMPASS
jgi:hypothetical protein